MNKVFGLSYIRVENGSWNNSFDGIPRMDFDGTFFATDKARKYSIRQDLLNSGQKVLIRKHKAEDGKYKSLSNILATYNIDAKAKDSNKKIIKDFIDVRLFGAIVNPKDANVLTTSGPVQFLYAKNQLTKEGYKSNEFELIDITSYKTSGETNETQTTIGKQCRIDKAYYMYPFIVNPNVYKNNLEEVLGNDISEKEIKDMYISDIKILKDSLKYDVSELNSCTKMGCTNFLNIIVTMKDENSNINLSALQDNIFVSEEEDVVNSKINVKINAQNLITMLENKKELIKTIEIHTPATSRFMITGLESLKDLGIEIIEERI